MAASPPPTLGAARRRMSGGAILTPISANTSGALKRRSVGAAAAGRLSQGTAMKRKLSFCTPRSSTGSRSSDGGIVYAQPRGREIDELQAEQADERLRGVHYAPSRCQTAMRCDGGEADTEEAAHDSESVEVDESDLPPALKRARKEKDRQQCLEKADEEAKAVEESSGIVVLRAQTEAVAAARAKAEDSSSSEGTDTDEEEGAKRVSRYPVSELGKVYFGATLRGQSDGARAKGNIVAMDVEGSWCALYDSHGKQMGHGNGRYTLRGDVARDSRMGDEVRVGARTVLLGGGVREAEFLSGSFFLRKHIRRRLRESKQRKEEAEKLKEDAREKKRNHLAHTDRNGVSGISFGTSMVSKALSAAFRPRAIRTYRPSANYTAPAKGVERKKAEQGHPQPAHDPDAEGAVVLFRAEYKYDTARRPLVSVVVDPILGSKLRPHQVAGVQFLWDCVTGERIAGRNGCILADDMGLGKSIQAIALLWTCLKQGKHGRPVARKAVVVAPSSLVQNWCNEINKWLSTGGDQDCKVCKGKGVVKRKDKCKACKGKGIEPPTLRIDPCAIAQSTVRGERILNTFEGDQTRNVLIISYDQLRKYEERLSQMRCVELVICDEGHRLKNAEIKTTRAVNMIPTPRRVILSGTPIQNDLGEFHAMVNFCNPGIVGSLSTFRSVFEGPIMAGREPDCEEGIKIIGEGRAQYLATETNRFILRRSSVINEKYLPAKLEQTVFVMPSKLQRALYSAVVECRDRIQDQECDGARTSPALIAITALKKLCNHPDLIHMIAREKPKSLPLVKSVFPKGYRELSSAEGVSGKLDFLSALLGQLVLMPSRTRDKVVVVSNYTQTLDVLAALCKARQVKYFQLDGNTPIKRRQELVDKFNVAGSPELVFLLSSKAGGVGLNLIGANRLVLFDPDWNPANDAQAMGRVWRPGQRKKVFIYRLLCTGTIEEKIYQRQVSKQGLSANVMDSTDRSKQHFTTGELRALFEIRTDTRCDTHDLLKCRCKQRKAASDASDVRKPFRCAARSGPRMDELRGWQHWASASEGNDEVLKAMDPEGNIVSFIFGNERDPGLAQEGPGEEKVLAKDAASVTVAGESGDGGGGDSGDEISVASDSESDDGSSDGGGESSSESSSDS
eukprot:TRINITY_DN18667_c0_g1_i1.p1 TRINITY_DN18667_c0_g1~~TRINITY_DN18667_c0_g1_i1.p1  ORF type:complete len:1131 (+),score=275.36 TRINITY_DN18667_c0_g1_i1:70-3462(+)